MKHYWITIGVSAISEDAANDTADRMARRESGWIVQVDQEPPQGSLIVGETDEDAIDA